MHTFANEISVCLLLALNLADVSSAFADGGNIGATNSLGPYGTLKDSYTTYAYRAEARSLMIKEANRVAKDLNLPETLPITEGNVVGGFTSPFAFAYRLGMIGRVVTQNYDYAISVSNRFSYLTIANYDFYDFACRKYLVNGMWPTNRIGTNGAYQLAVQWLAAAHMDVEGLNRDCKVSIEPSLSWSGIYTVAWCISTNITNPLNDLFSTNRSRSYSYVPSGKASVELFEPTATLVQLRVEDAKYNLREPLVFTNLAELVGGTNILALARMAHLLRLA